jgi:hypothetical protein
MVLSTECLIRFSQEKKEKKKRMLTPVRKTKRKKKLAQVVDV